MSAVPSTVPPPLAPEDQLLVECTRLALDADRRRRIGALVAGGLDWAYLLETSVRHAVAPLVARALEQTAASEEGLPPVPAGARARLAELYEVSEARSRRLFGALSEILYAFDAHRIDVVGLKDLQLAVDVYGDRALRPLGDLDLLIRRGDYEEVRRSLGALGFVPEPAAGSRFALMYGHGVGFRRARDDVWVDVQWDVAQREWDPWAEGSFRYDVGGLWKRAVDMVVDGRTVLVPATEDLLFHLCVHLEGHAYSELILFVDIAELLAARGADVDWDSVVALARSHGAESSVYYVLLLTEQLLGVGAPPEVLAALQPRYFQANLFSPAFGNLAELHHALDEIERAASPPQELLGQFELVVRRQAARGRRLFAEMNAFASCVATDAILVFAGSAPRRLVPDPRVEAFEDLQAFVLRRELARVRDALAACGFTDTGGTDASARKRCLIASKEPALSGRATFLTIEVDVDTAFEPARAPKSASIRSSKEWAALRSLGASFRGQPPSDNDANVRLVIHALEAEELLVAVAAHAGGQARDRLFALVSVLEVLRGGGELDWSHVCEVARRHGVEARVRAMLRLAIGVLGHERCADLLRDPVIAQTPPPRALEWGRLDAELVGTRPALRDAFAFLFCLVALRGISSRVQYFLGGLFDIRAGAPVLVRLARTLAEAARESARGRARSRELAYWTRPVATSQDGVRPTERRA